MIQAGTQAQALLSDNIILDFSGLFSGEPIEKAPYESPVEPILEDGQYKSSTEQEKPAEGLKTGLQGQQKAEAPTTPAKALIMQSQREDEDRKRTLEVYKTYQENIRKSGQLQTDILKGIKAGTDIYTLFLQAIDAISRMTSNTCFRSQIEEDLKSIYGAGLLEKPPLKLELEQTQTRLQRLTEAREREQSLDSKQRIGAAIKAHENRIAELEALLNRASEDRKTQL